MTAASAASPSSNSSALRSTRCTGLLTYRAAAASDPRWPGCWSRRPPSPAGKPSTASTTAKRGRTTSAPKHAAREADSAALLAHATAEQVFVLIDLDETTAAVDQLAHARTIASGTATPLLRAWLAAAHGETLAAAGHARRRPASLRRPRPHLLPADPVDPDAAVPVPRRLPPRPLARQRPRPCSATPEAIDQLTDALARLPAVVGPRPRRPARRPRLRPRRRRRPRRRPHLRPAGSPPRRSRSTPTANYGDSSRLVLPCSGGTGRVTPGSRAAPTKRPRPDAVPARCANCGHPRQRHPLHPPGLLSISRLADPLCTPPQDRHRPAP